MKCLINFIPRITYISGIITMYVGVRRRRTLLKVGHKRKYKKVAQRVDRREKKRKRLTLLLAFISSTLETLEFLARN